MADEPADVLDVVDVLGEEVAVHLQPVGVGGEARGAHRVQDVGPAARVVRQELGVLHRRLLQLGAQLVAGLQQTPARVGTRVAEPQWTESQKKKNPTIFTKFYMISFYLTFLCNENLL